jgi:ribosomal protein L21
MDFALIIISPKQYCVCRLLSMSSEKYDAIVEAGIVVMQRVSIPDEKVPAGASVEIEAKVSAGYHTGTLILNPSNAFGALISGCCMMC